MKSIQVNKNIIDLEYAVRGPIPQQAAKLKQEGRNIIPCNIGNPQALGQKPITFYREVLSLLDDITEDLRDPDSLESVQPAFAQNEPRSLREEYLVVNMHCTHLGCVPQMIPQVGPQPFESNWKGGFYCPCHKSKFDLAGRVFKGVPAPTNLLVPAHSFLLDDTLLIGVDPEGAA